jgi:hypothetical protein
MQICFVSPELPPSQKTKAGVINPGFFAGSSLVVFNLGGKKN